MPGMILREARKLGVDERRRLIGLLRAQVPDGPGRAGGEPDACPRCGGTHLVRKGHDRDGSQRWACRSCGRTLSRKTMGLLGYSKPEEDVWASYVEHACAGGTPGECARACGVCPGTSWLVRMRLCEVMGRALAPSGSGPTVSCQVDGTYLDESLAGNRSRSAAGMPREPHRCGGAVRERGISNPEVCVVCGGRPRRRVLRGRGPGPADRRGVRPRPWGPWARERPSRPTASGGTPGRPPRLRVAPRRDARAGGRARRARHGGRDAREARGLPGAPRGVSTRRLGHYLDWFLWDEQTRRPDADRADTLSGQAATGSYDNTRLALAREPQPFWSYWEDKLAVSTVV